MQNTKSVLMYTLSIVGLCFYLGYIIYGKPVSFGSIFSAQAILLIGYGIIISSITLVIFYREEFLIHSAALYFSMLYILSVFSIAWATSSSLAISGIYFSFIPFLFIFITVNTVEYRYWKYLLIGITISMSLMIFVTWIMYGSIRFVLPINANTAVFGILPGLPFLINSYYQSNVQLFKLSLASIILFAIISLILTKSRAPIIVIAFFFAITSVIDHNKLCGWKITHLSRKLMITLPITAILFSILTPEIVERYVSSTIQLWQGMSTLFSSGPSQSEIVSLRAKVYFASYSLLQNPEVYLRGVGYNNFSVYMGMIPGFPRMNPHNFPLRILMELGIAGFLCLVLGFTSSFRSYMSKITSNNLSDKEKSKYVSGLWGLAFMLLLSLFNPLLLDPILFILLSLPYVISQEAGHENKI